MSLDKLNKKKFEEDKLKKKLLDTAEDSDNSGQADDGSDSSTGTQSGIVFREFIGSAPSREDLLPPDEKKRLIIVHQDLHEVRVKKEKSLREDRKALKEGKITVESYHQGMSSGFQSQYKINPILADKAQFSGIDRQVIPLPSENVAETNQENRNELEHQYRLRYAPDSAPRFNPKPIYR